jgi:hypothetical protein
LGPQPQRDPRTRPRDRRSRLQLGLAICVGFILVLAVFELLFPHLWYGLHQLSDVHRDLVDATRVAHGKMPYRDFTFEYPPLTLPLLLIPGHTGDAAVNLAAYQRWFAFEMFLLTLATLAVVALTARMLWRAPRRTYQAVAAFALTAAAAGAIIENRFDIAVALTVAVLTLLLVRRATLAAGVVVGLGIALKLTPVVLLPLVMIVAQNRRKAAEAAAAAAGTALLAYLPFLALAPRGVLRSLSYHLVRPLEVESVLATPLLARHLVGGAGVRVDYTYGSENVFGPGAPLLATMAGLLTAIAVALACVLVWRGRTALRRAPEKIPVAVMTLLLATITFGKVVSPQYLIWLLPAAALILVDDHVLGLLALCSVLATQLEFPALFPSLVRLEAAGVTVVLCRNLLLAATLLVAFGRLAALGRPGAEEGAPADDRRAPGLRASS